MKYFSLIVTMLLCVGAVYGQQTVSGTVTDSEGSPLIGANVAIDGTDPIIGTTTDLDGNYTIQIPEGYNTLAFSYAGYTTEKREATAGTLDVTLELGVAIDGVVVTAMGISRDEKSIGYAVSEVDGSEIAGSGETNAVQGLAGKAAGVQIIGSGGVPGASSKILIRGNATFSGENQPLFVVDGIPYNNRTEGTVAGDFPFNANLGGVNNGNRMLDLNPNDIENVTILKGPAAAALYGTRAANGAVIVTTKTGQTRQKGGFDVSYNTSVDISQVNKLPDLQTTYAQGLGGGVIETDPATGQINYVEDGTYITANTNTGPGTVNGTASSWGPRIGGPNDTFGLSSFNNMDTYFQTGLTFNNDIAISGGNEFSSFRLSYGNTNNSGIVPNTDLNRNTVRLNARLGNQTFSVRGNASYTNTTGTRAQNGSNLSGVMLSLTRMPASFDVLGGQGPNGYDNPDGSAYNYFLFYDNPLWSANNNPQTNSVNRVTGGITMNYNPAQLDWLSFTYRISADAYTDYRKQIFAIGAWDPPSPTGQISENSQRHLEVNSDFLVTAERKFTDDITTSLTLGNNLNHRNFDYLYSRGRNLTIPDFYNLSNASDLYASQSSVTRRLAGLFFDARFSYKSLVFLNVAGRNDWASTFGEEARGSGFFYPSVSSSFVFSELLPENDILSFGKFRASFAQSGIEPDPYTTNTYLTAPFLTDGFTDGLGFPYLGQTGLGVSSVLGNAQLEPEILTGTEVGVDLRFFKGRLNLDLTYYNQVSSNLLISRPISAASGYEFVVANAGSMVNRGWEALLEADIIRKKGFSWNSSLNFTANQNEVLELAEGVDEINIEAAFSSIGSYAIAGQPYGALYATTWEKDANGNLIIGPDGLPIVGERGNVGNPFPDWIAGFRNTFSYKGIRLSALLDFRQGGDIWAGTIARLHRLGRTAASAEGRDGSVTYLVEGVQQSVDDQGDAEFDADGSPIATSTQNNIEISAFEYYNFYKGDNGAATEEAVEDGSWVRLRELTLSYTIPTSKIKLLQNAEVYFTGRNLWLSTTYPGVDPETSLTGAGSNVNGFDYFNMPNTQSFIFGLRTKF